MVEKYIYDLSREELAEYFIGLGEAKYRAEQVYGALHKGTLFEKINIPKTLKEKIGLEFHTDLPAIVGELKSKDGTVKYLLKLYDGNLIECVLLRQDYGNTVCISSQVGCKMGCVFCASGADGFVRNLSAGEMLAQVILMNTKPGSRDLICNVRNVGNMKGCDGDSKGTAIFGVGGGVSKAESGINTDVVHAVSGNSGGNATSGNSCGVTNVVLMGSGEPLDNFDNVVKFLCLVDVGARHISLSTAGIVPKIREFADLGLQVNLCISLHAPSDEVRMKIMPVARKWSVADLIDSAKYFFEKTRRRVIFEYSLIDGVNCSQEQALELARLVRGFPTHINLINLNSTGGIYKAPDRKTALAFMDTLIKAGASCTMRKSRGADIAAACGQLKRRVLQ